MSALLERLFGRLPIGWLQLTHSKPRLAAALAGVAFANILIFMQLGFMGAIFETSVFPYRGMAGHALVFSSEGTNLGDIGTVPRARLFQALAVPGVADATPVHLGRLGWTDAETGETTNFRIFGIDPESEVFASPAVREAQGLLRLPDTALMDAKTRGLPPDKVAQAAAGRLSFELAGRRIEVLGTFEMGASFDVDGTLIVSDQTFLRLFPERRAGAPSLISLDLAPDADHQAVMEAVRAALGEGDALARTLPDMIAAEQRYQGTQTPVGIVFGFGVAIGLLVGLIIVYQVLSTDVADHLAEYATLKAIGYRQRFFLGLVFEEALLLALLGFLPGIAISLGLYEAASRATGLPIAMDATRPVLVVLLTLAMCAVSGAIATRRLAAADPADLF